MEDVQIPHDVKHEIDNAQNDFILPESGKFLVKKYKNLWIKPNFPF